MAKKLEKYIHVEWFVKDGAATVTIRLGKRKKIIHTGNVRPTTQIVEALARAQMKVGKSMPVMWFAHKPLTIKPC